MGMISTQIFKTEAEILALGSAHIYENTLYVTTDTNKIYIGKADKTLDLIVNKEDLSIYALKSELVSGLLIKQNIIVAGTHIHKADDDVTLSVTTGSEDANIPTMQDVKNAITSGSVSAPVATRDKAGIVQIGEYIDVTPEGIINVDGNRLDISTNTTITELSTVAGNKQDPVVAGDHIEIGEDGVTISVTTGTEDGDLATIATIKGLLSKNKRVFVVADITALNAITGMDPGDEALVGASEPYQNYIYALVGGTLKWERIGITSIQLENYYTKAEIDALMTAKQNALDALTATVNANEEDIENKMTDAVGRITVNEQDIAAIEAIVATKQEQIIAGTHLKLGEDNKTLSVTTGLTDNDLATIETIKVLISTGAIIPGTILDMLETQVLPESFLKLNGSALTGASLTDARIPEAFRIKGKLPDTTYRVTYSDLDLDSVVFLKVMFIGQA